MEKTFAKKFVAASNLQKYFSPGRVNMIGEHTDYNGGLSSSASIELLTTVILNTEFNFGLEQIELVKLSQRAENEFVGMNCGIKFAVGMGRNDCAILLDCNTLTFAYNERRKQCEHALSENQRTLHSKAPTSQLSANS